MKMSRRERRLEKRKERLDRLRKEAHKEHVVGEKRLPKENEYTGFLKFLRDQYKPLMLIPLAMLVFSLVVISMTYSETGSLMYKGVSLQGGISLTIPVEEPVNVPALEFFLEERFQESDLDIRILSEAGSQKGLIIDASNVKEDAFLAALRERVSLEEYSIETLGPSLGDAFFTQALWALVIAFVLMSLVVLIYFRTLVPSAAVIVAAVCDMLFALAGVNLLELRLSTAGLAAFLMLIGYSVDTDILLTARVLKGKEGSVFDRVVSALKTGFLMNIVALATTIVTLTFSHSAVITQIMWVLLFGLIADIINTWIQNAGILRYYLERKGVR
ncbi:MAG TPA: protein translocase subunit SecF [Candidatus Nanoarchaeia archaeon]|nr:protein translocase subunit SecF [Candidatus Nanoarchaeia archaeon]